MSERAIKVHPATQLYPVELHLDPNQRTALDRCRELSEQRGDEAAIYMHIGMSHFGVHGELVVIAFGDELDPPQTGSTDVPTPDASIPGDTPIAKAMWLVAAAHEEVAEGDDVSVHLDAIGRMLKQIAVEYERTIP